MWRKVSSSGYLIWDHPTKWCKIGCSLQEVFLWPLRLYLLKRMMTLSSRVCASSRALELISFPLQHRSGDLQIWNDRQNWINPKDDEPALAVAHLRNILKLWPWNPQRSVMLEPERGSTAQVQHTCASCRVCVLCCVCLLLTCLYVGSLYVWRISLPRYTARLQTCGSAFGLDCWTVAVCVQGTSQCDKALQCQCAAGFCTVTRSGECIDTLGWRQGEYT